MDGLTPVSLQVNVTLTGDQVPSLSIIKLYLSLDENYDINDLYTGILTYFHIYTHIHVYIYTFIYYKSISYELSHTL